MPNATPAKHTSDQSLLFPNFNRHCSIWHQYNASAGSERGLRIVRTFNLTRYSDQVIVGFGINVLTAVFRATVTAAVRVSALDVGMSARRPRPYTLAGMYADRIDLWVYCNAEPTVCYRSAKIDLIAMIMRYGDLPGPELKRRLKCQACGSKDIATSMSAPGGFSQPPRELPVEARKKILADAIARGTEAVNAARAEIRAGKPARL